MKKVLDYLEELDFSKSEARIYLALLESGPMTVADLARATNLNRTAAYPYITSLLEKGVIAEIMQGSRKQLTATEPERLHYIIEKKLESIKRIETKFPDIVTTIQTSFTKTPTDKRAEVKYYKGRNGIRTIYEDCLKANELRCYVNIVTIHIALPENTTLFVNSFKQNKLIKMFEIFEDISTSREVIKEFQLKILNQDRYFYKFLPSGITFSATDTLIYDGKIAVINVADKNNINGVVMENKEYYSNSKQLFDLMWKMLPEPNPNS